VTRRPSTVAVSACIPGSCSSSWSRTRSNRVGLWHPAWSKRRRVIRRTELVLLVACRSVTLLGFDAKFEAELVGRRLGLRCVP
jgi:hypothetical protein